MPEVVPTSGIECDDAQRHVLHHAGDALRFFRQALGAPRWHQLMSSKLWHTKVATWQLESEATLARERWTCKVSPWRSGIPW